MTQGTRLKLRSLAIALGLFLCVLAGQCHGKAKQYQIVSVCVDHHCTKISIGTIAITAREIYITLDGIKTVYQIKHYFPNKGLEYYRIESKDFDGWLVVGQRSATMELYKTTIKYIFK